MSEKIYIFKRKLKAFLGSLPYYVCRIFPIKKNKVVVWTFETKGGYACSPKYIAEEMLRRNELGETEWSIYWLVDDLNKDFPSQISKVKSSLWSRAYHMSTAKYWVSNTRTFYEARKRKGTLYFQTWHGSVALKPIGKYRGEKFSNIAYLVSKHDSDMIDFLLSPSDWCTKTWRDGLIYDGDIVETGAPRNDVLINNVVQKHKEFREAYHLPQNARICLYAPTFRSGSQSTKRSVSSEPITLDFQKLITVLEKRFGGTWYIFLRLHPQLASIMDGFPIVGDKQRLIDVSKRPDMAEIMAATDAIITDYSTVVFEGFLTGQPGFIYADDLGDYIADRGQLMFQLDEIPFSVSQNNDELMLNIEKFDIVAYQRKAKEFIKEIISFDDGLASKRVVDLMLEEGSSKL